MFTKPFQYATTIRDFIGISPFRAVIVVNMCLTTDADAVFHEGIGRRFCPPVVSVGWPVLPGAFSSRASTRIAVVVIDKVAQLLGFVVAEPRRRNIDAL